MPHHVPATRFPSQLQAIKIAVNTATEAFRAGIPQRVVPYAFDQFDNGLRAKNLGVAQVVLARKLSVRRVHQGLATLLASEQVMQRCAAIASQDHPDPAGALG